MNKLKNCSECGRLYMEIGQGMCQDCFRKEQEMEQVVVQAQALKEMLQVHLLVEI